MIKSKKAQGLGGLLKVVVFGILFLAFFPFMSIAFQEAASQHTGATSWLISAIIFVAVYLFLKFAYNLGADAE